MPFLPHRSVGQFQELKGSHHPRIAIVFHLNLTVYRAPSISMSSGLRYGMHMTHVPPRQLPQPYSQVLAPIKTGKDLNITVAR